MKKRRNKIFNRMTIVALLLISLILVGCGGGETETDGQSGEVASAGESGETTESGEATESGEGDTAADSSENDGDENESADSEVEHERSLDTENGTMKEDSVEIGRAHV